MRRLSFFVPIGSNGLLLVATQEDTLVEAGNCVADADGDADAADTVAFATADADAVVATAEASCR